MSPEKNPLEVYKILPKTNCGQCYLPSCLAFAAAVISGAKKPADCPFVAEELGRTVAPLVVTTEPYAVLREEKLHDLQAKVREMDLARLADTIGGRMVGDRLAIPCLGKDFLIDSQGGVYSECHTHAGLTIPLLSYIVTSNGSPPAGDWVHFRDLSGGPPMNALFEQRGEKRLQKLADSHTDLFDDLVSMFSGTRKKEMFGSDIAIILSPLPRLPVLFCYWQPEEDLGSRLDIYFDVTADRHLSIEWIFELTVGMVMMFDKIALKHM